MNPAVQHLLDLRSEAIDAYIDGRIDQAAIHADLDAITVELDRLIFPGRRERGAARATRVLAAILADSRARVVAIPPAKAARTAYWLRRRQEELIRDDPAAAEAERRSDAVTDAAEPDDGRMLTPILAALQSRSTPRTAAARVEAIATRPRPESDLWELPAAPDVSWTNADRLTWEEMRDGVPCQGCGRPFLGDERRQHNHEPWPAYRERMAPIEAAFESCHPDHGTRWTVGDGPLHCRRCCAPHPLSPGQIAELNRLMNPPAPTPPVAPAVATRRCSTCHQPLDDGHVCNLADLPKALQAVVKAVLERERSVTPTEVDGRTEPAPGRDSR